MKANVKRAARQQFFKIEFDKLAINGYIGDPQGQLAYAYLRVSSDEQGEEGRSGLPRQIQHCHEIAQRDCYKIPWDMVFADDDSGFKLDRPELDVLRKEYKQKSRRASIVVIEALDRLSRNADWHQGFLLDEMRTIGISYVFWKSLGSRIERAVQGAVAQEGMEQAKERMRDGLRAKQDDGRITAKTPALGYKFVDDNGQENTPRVARMTHYAIDENRRACIEFIFDQLANQGSSAIGLVKALDEKGITDPRFRPTRAKVWSDRSVAKIIRNPLYKGEYIANRLYKEEITRTNEHGEVKKSIVERERAESEWIRTKVDPLVDADTWQLANNNLWKNKHAYGQNAKYEYLLSGLVRCDTCGCRYQGQTTNPRPEARQYQTKRRYYCSKVYKTPAVRREHPCGQPSIKIEVLDNAIWQIVTTWLLDPDVVNRSLDERYAGADIQAKWNEIAYIEAQIEGKTADEKREHALYLAGGYTPEEFAAMRRQLIREREKLTEDANRIRAQIMTPEELAAKKQKALDTLNRMKGVDLSRVPFALKRQLVRLTVDEVILNTTEGWLRVDGIVGSVMLDSLFNPASVDSIPVPLHSIHLTYHVTYSLWQNAVVNTEMALT